MKTSELIADLDYASAIAKDGANTPLLGGSIGLMWGILVIPTLVFHGLTMLGKTPVALEQIGLLWAAYGVIGTILNILLGRRIDRKSGSRSMINKIGAALGISMGIIIFSYAITTMYVTASQGLPVYTYSTIMVVAFALTCMNLAVLGHITGKTYLKVSAIIAGGFMALCMIMVTQIHVYFVAALGVLCVQVIPGLIEVSQEKRHDG